MTSTFSTSHRHFPPYHHHLIPSTMPSTSTVTLTKRGKAKPPLVRAASPQVSRFYFASPDPNSRSYGCPEDTLVLVHDKAWLLYLSTLVYLVETRGVL